MAESVSIKIRLHRDGDVALGPGKADLLQAIETHGSISAAGRSMKMSYKRAWDLVNTMNNSFSAPLVMTTKGGQHGGGTKLTALGRDILMAYRLIERKAHASVADDLDAITALLQS